jgi:ferrochelatase
LTQAGTAKSHNVVTPGFTADCLETFDEIGHESLEVFRHAGGEALRAIVTQEGQGWL